MVGGRGRDRTGDPLLAKQVLSQLSYTPTEKNYTHSKALSSFLPVSIHLFRPRPCIYRALIRLPCSLHRDRAHSFGNRLGHFACVAVKLLQNVALHLQLHLRVLLEDLRVTLAQHLSHPFVRYSSCT